MTTPVCQLAPAQPPGRGFIMRGLEGEVVKLDLLRLLDVADYSATPELVPATPISGAEAFNRYIPHTPPLLRDSGGELRFLVRGGSRLIGPESKRRDLVMLVSQRRVQSFLAFAQHEACLAGIGHRTAAIEDSLLLPLSELPWEGAA
jgi:hypothetical protein